MRQYLPAVLAATAVATFTAGPALATALTLTGKYIKVGISDYGTLGSNDSASPGLLHDPTGSGTFGVNDYLTPGTPHEGFAAIANEFDYTQNDNDGYSGFGTASPVLLTGTAAMGYANAASWTGSNAFLTITNSYFFNPGDQRILVNTSITALSDLTNLAFSRSLDPDPDVNTFGSYDTNNQRGNSLYGMSDFVGAAGARTGLTVALVNLNGDTYAHNTEIGVGSCCDNRSPYDVLAGNGINTSSSDDSINLAYLIGTLRSGQTASLTYSYSVGDNIDVVGPPTGGVPEPATWAMMLGGMAFVGGAMRRARGVKASHA